LRYQTYLKMLLRETLLKEEKKMAGRAARAAKAHA